MVWWAVVAGALIGFLTTFNGIGGALLGGLLGLGFGKWLQTELRREIETAVSRALYRADHPLDEAPEAAAPPVGATPAIPTRAPAQSILAAPLPEPVKAPEEPARSAPGFTQTTSALEHLAARLRDWFLGGNTIVRVGLLVLFAGLVLLARLVAAAGLFPIEARLATVGLVGAALLGIGLAKRIARPDFALHLQGGGVAVMFLTVFAAARIFAVLPAPAAFGFMIVIAALGALLAVKQNSLVMALASFLGGYSVPVLLGGAAETPLGLFSYITVLNLAVLGIAGKKSWRSLNLLGFFATFAIAALWGAGSYEDRHFLICEIFLAISVAIYLATAVLYAHNTPGKLGNFADSTLLFGTAITGFGLQAAMVQDRPYASAWSALVFGAAYLGLTAWTMRRKDPAMRLLNESLLAIGIGFVTMAVPLALEAKWTSAAWALEGAGAFWVGSRQARWMPRAFGMALQALAAMILLVNLGPNLSRVPLLNSGFFGPLLIALPLIFTAWLLRREQPHSGSGMALAWAPSEQGLRHAWFLAGFGFAALALLSEVARELPTAAAQGWNEPVFAWWQQGLLAMLAMLGLMGLSDWAGRQHQWRAACWPGRFSLPVIGLAYLVTLANGRRVLYLPDLLAWALAIGLHLWLLRRQDRDCAGISRKWNGAVHTLGVVLGTAWLADCMFELIDRADLWDSSWAGVVMLLAASCTLALLTRWAGTAAKDGVEGLGWPRDPHARAYWWRAGAILALLTFAGALSAAWFAEGVSDPLPYVPALNPVDLSVGLALLALAQWRQMLGRAKDPGHLAGNAGLALGAGLGFVAINGMWLRTAHHFMGAPWDYTTLSNPTVLTGFSILWTLIAMGLMLFAQRRALRLPWLAGASLLGAVVIKLLFIDMSQIQGFPRIIAFIGVGVLMLLIGYFVPLPPRKGEKAPPRKGEEKA